MPCRPRRTARPGPGALAWAAALAVAVHAGPIPLHAQDPAPPPAPQNPSPMVEHTRAHERVPALDVPGRRLVVDAGLDHPVRLFVPAGVDLRRNPALLVHFHGASYIPERAAAELPRPTVAATVHLGGGSGRYDRAFDDPAAFDRLLASIRQSLGELGGDTVTPGAVLLSGFSAGHGAVRAILRDPAHFERVDAVLLLDGLHTGYDPPATVLDRGGTLDTTMLASILRFARAAAAGSKRILVTHSEIFPGTFASTTETTDWLIGELGLAREPVLSWGPVGMQQLSQVRRGGLAILGFAGNSAPDHVDHFHGMIRFLRELAEP